MVMEAGQANQPKGEEVTAHSHPGEVGQGWDLTQVPCLSMLSVLCAPWTFLQPHPPA